MKTSISIFLFTLSILILGQTPAYENWKNISKDNINLQPEYGNIVKTEEQLSADQDFITDILNHYKTKEEASEELVKLGMNYLYNNADFETAMKRFNQAYLLNSNNPNIYYGYGSIFFNLGAWIFRFDLCQ